MNRQASLQIFLSDPDIPLLLASQFIDIDSDTLKVMYVIFATSAFVQGMVSAESKKVNHRM